MGGVISTANQLKTHLTVQKPPRLRRGGRIGVVAPAGRVDRDEVEASPVEGLDLIGKDRAAASQDQAAPVDEHHRGPGWIAPPRMNVEADLAAVDLLEDEGLQDLTPRGSDGDRPRKPAPSAGNPLPRKSWPHGTPRLRPSRGS